MDSYGWSRIDPDQIVRTAGFERAQGAADRRVYLHPEGDAAIIGSKNQAFYLKSPGARANAQNRKDLTTIVDVLTQIDAHTRFNPSAMTLFTSAGALAGYALTQDPYLTVLGGATGALIHEGISAVRAHNARRRLEPYGDRLLRGHQAWGEIMTRSSPMSF